MNNADIAIIGGGLTGLTAAIRAAEQGHHVDLYEAAPQLGGRTRSFFHQPSQTWVDHGPHLLIGVYERTLQLLQEIDALKNTTWQKSLTLPLWDAKRGHFELKASPHLPFPLALIHAVQQMPGHGWAMIPSLLRMAYSLKKNSMKEGQTKTVAEWMQSANIQRPLQRDMIEVLCLGAMNEAMDTADAASFSHVLQQAFANHRNARLGWFTKPLSHALIEPLMQRCMALGVHIHTSSRVLSLQSNHQGCTLTTRSATSTYEKIVLATPPSIRNKLLNIQQTIATSPITNVHLWFEQTTTLSSPFIGGIDTYGQWFFDVSHQFNQNTADKHTLSHLCAVISADKSKRSKQEKVHLIINELRSITGDKHLDARHYQITTVQAATHLVRPSIALLLPDRLIDACEQPALGELPATIESAIVRGEQAAIKISDN
ncbi:MAG: FAD-dependent oxidoreductase [Mariprofundaceae bacterium]|nr:FAD-dependent oxidoreductase [Mariprofundaceae bacterium]